MIKVYIAGCYSADNVLDVLKNIGRGCEMGAKLFSCGFAPFVPWHDADFVLRRPYNDFTVEQFYQYSLAWLEVSDCILVLPGFEQSKGTVKEIEVAEELGLPVFYNLPNLIKWSESND